MGNLSVHIWTRRGGRWEDEEEGLSERQLMHTKCLQSAIKSLGNGQFLSKLNDSHFNRKQEGQIRDQVMILINNAQGSMFFSISEYLKFKLKVPNKMTAIDLSLFVKAKKLLTLKLILGCIAHILLPCPLGICIS